jgi:hypothetical protein
MNNFIARVFCAISISAIASTASAWEVFTETGDDGRVFTVAEQQSEAGAFLTLVCVEQKTHIEIIVPIGQADVDDATMLLQIDGQPERLLSGYIESIDASTSVFVALDRRDEPAVATNTLINEIIAGRELYAGDPDMREAYDRWPLSGSAKAVGDMRGKCK